MLIVKLIGLWKTSINFIPEQPVIDDDYEYEWDYDYDYDGTDGEDKRHDRMLIGKIVLVKLIPIEGRINIVGAEDRGWIDIILFYYFILDSFADRVYILEDIGDNARYHFPGELLACWDHGLATLIRDQKSDVCKSMLDDALIPYVLTRVYLIYPGSLVELPSCERGFAFSSSRAWHTNCSYAHNYVCIPQPIPDMLYSAFHVPGGPFFRVYSY
ncbi:hypothetical protein KQX54_007267 [Cotesia glomerata]|uniref:Uncharacterized protein n=1 Tax=Cotesia glomerata TaxID=32391 RepID=A0AAV7I160_COTGL|nr:hypothetical protein KQX54_007267 [Cotesia glomerata]